MSKQHNEGLFTRKQNVDPVSRLADLAGTDPEAVKAAMRDYAQERGQEDWDWVSDDADAIDRIIAAAQKLSSNRERHVWLNGLARSLNTTVKDIERTLDQFTNHRNEVEKAIDSNVDPWSFAASEKGENLRNAVRQTVRRGK